MNQYLYKDKSILHYNFDQQSQLLIQKNELNIHISDFKTLFTYNKILQEIKFKLNGGGNIKSIICSTCVNNSENPNLNIDQKVDLTTTQEQRQSFLDNIEQQVDNIRNSSSTLKNQNSKLIFTQSLNWIQYNQLVVFDIMISLKGDNHDIIEIFEDSIIKLLESVQITLKKSKNIYLGYLIVNQISVLATSVYRYYLSYPINSTKQQKIQQFKNQINEKLEKIYSNLENLQNLNISTNQIEQCLKLINSFTLVLPDQSFKPIINFVSGLSQVIAFGGTRGWDTMLDGAKQTVSQIINNKIHQESIDNYIFYITIEKVKYSLIKIVLKTELSQVQKDEQIINILQTIGKTIENSQNWAQKYYFVQFLSEFVLFRSNISLSQLKTKLKQKNFPFKFSIQEIWELLLQNNWISQFQFNSDENEKIGFLNPNRQILQDLNLNFEKGKISKNKKNKISQQKEELETQDKKPDGIKLDFITSLNTILEEFEPITLKLREFILKGDKQGFKGLLSYCFEGLEDTLSIQNILKDGVIDLFSGKDPLEIIEISVKKIMNFSIDFFKNQFISISSNSESQLRKVFIAYFSDYEEQIAQSIILQRQNFDSILDTHPSIKNFPNLVAGFIDSMTQFIDKILNYLVNIFNSLKQVQCVTNIVQDQKHMAISLQKFLASKSLETFYSMQEELESLILNIFTNLEQIRQLSSFSNEDQTAQVLNRINIFIDLLQNLQTEYEKIRLYSIILQNEITPLIEPEYFSKIKHIQKKIGDFQNKDSKYSECILYLQSMFQNDQIISETNTFCNNIKMKIENLKKNLKNSLKIIYNEIEEFQDDEDNQTINDEDENHFMGKIYYYIKMINEILKKTQIQHRQIIQDLQYIRDNSQSSGQLTNAFNWITLINQNIQNYLQFTHEERLSVDSLKLFLQEQQSIILQKEIEYESNNKFLNCCEKIFLIFQDSMKLINEFFMQIFESQQQSKKINPELTNTSVNSFMGSTLNNLTSFMSFEMDSIKESLLDDIKTTLKDFQNSEFSQNLKTTITQIRSFTSFIDLGGLVQTLEDKYSDQSWRIRDRVILTLFDLNRNFGGDDGDQIFANTLIQIKAKETNLKVQQTLKTEELLFEMKSILQTNWQSQEKEIKNYIQKNFTTLEEEVKKMREDKNLDQKKIFKFYEKKERQLNQQLDNISDIGQLSGIQIEFLKDIKKQVFKLQQTVEQVKEILKNVEENVSLIKGKSVYQQLEQRRKDVKDVTESKQQIYVNISLCGHKCNNNQRIGDNSFQFFDINTNENLNSYSVKLKNISGPDSDEPNSPCEQNQEFNQFPIKESLIIQESLNNSLSSQLKRHSSDDQDSQKSHSKIEEIDTQKEEFHLDNLQKEQQKFNTKFLNESQDNYDNELSRRNTVNFMTHEFQTKKGQVKNIKKQNFIQQIVSKSLLHAQFNQNQQTKKEIILDSFLQDQYNSMLIHGQVGSGKSRLCEQIEDYIWENRKISKNFILNTIQKDKKVKKILKEYSVDDIYNIMVTYQLIDQQGNFTDLFIEIESEFEDNKTSNRIKKQKNQEEDEDLLEVKDIITESGQQLFQKKFALLHEFLQDQQKVRAIYGLLDLKFQDSPYPIYIQLSKTTHPRKDLFRESLESSIYNFSPQQILNLKELAMEGEINLIFILDGYNELKQEFQGINLFKSNGFENFIPKQDRLLKYPKMIITCTTSFLKDDYSDQFKNIVQRKLNVTYNPSNHYLEYIINDLDSYQQQQFFKQQFILSLWTVCYHNFESKYNYKRKNLEQYDTIQYQFDILWQKIYSNLLDEQEYAQLWVSVQLIEIIKSEFNNVVKQNILLPFSDDELQKFCFRISKLQTQRNYEIIVKKLKIGNLLITVDMMTTLINAIKKLMEKLSSEEEIIRRIKTIINQENILKDQHTISLDLIIELLTKGDYNLIQNFSLSSERETVQEQIGKLLSKDHIIKQDVHLIKNLKFSISFAMYQQDLSRFKLYDIFCSNYMKYQIKQLQEKGQNVMLQDCKQFLVSLAVAFHEHGIQEDLELTKQSLLYQKKGVWDEFFDDSDHPIKKYVRMCLPIISQGNLYRFIHSSIRDFILAHQFYKVINSLEINDEFIQQLILFKEQQQMKAQNIVFKQQMNLNDVQPKIETIENSEDSSDISQLNQKDLIQLIVKHSQNTFKQAIEDKIQKEVIQKLSSQIYDIQKQIQDKNDDQLSIKDRKNEYQFSYLQKLIDNQQLQDQFILFYSMNTHKKLNGKQFKEQIVDILQKTEKIRDLHLNQTADLNSYKNRQICDFILDQMSILDIPDPTNIFIDNLYKLIELGRLDSRFSNSAANAIGLLVLKSYSFNKSNFSGLNLSGINLYGGQFYKCQFDHCNMEGINLSSSVLYMCKFFDTNLNNSILSHCTMDKCQFNKMSLNNIYLGCHLDINYNDQIQIQNGETFEADPLLHIVQDPFDNDLLIVFHRYNVFKVNIKFEGSIQLIKKFDKQLNKCGMINYSKKKYLLIVGIQNQIGLLNLKNIEIIDYIKLQNIDKIKQIQYNDINDDVLIGGENKNTKQIFIEIVKFNNDGKGLIISILTDQCDHLVIDSDKQLLICHRDEKQTDKSIFYCFDQKNYQQVGDEQSLNKKLKIKKYGHLKKNLQMQKNSYITHPISKNVHIFLQEKQKNFCEIIVQDIKEITKKDIGPDGTVIQTKKQILDEIDCINTHIFEQKKYGKATQIIVNPFYPEIVICAYSKGLIKRMNIKIQQDQNNYLLHEQQIQQIKFLVQVKNKDNELLSCFIKDQFNGVVNLVKFQFQIVKDNQEFRHFQISQTCIFKTRKLKLLGQKEQNIRHDVIELTSHEKLQQEFILVVFQNKQKLLKFILNTDFNLIRNEEGQSVNVDKLTPEGYQFQQFVIHPDDHNIFYFGYDQLNMENNPLIVVYDVLNSSILNTILFDFSPQTKWSLYLDKQNNLTQLFTHNSQGQIKVYDSLKYEDIQKNQILKSHKQQESFIKLSEQQDLEVINISDIYKPTELLHLQTQSSNKLSQIIGFYPQDQNILISYDYLNSEIMLYNLSSDKPPIQINLSQCIVIQSQNKQKKAIGFFMQVKDDIEKFYKKNNSTVQLAFDQGNQKEILTLFQDRIQFLIHPTKPYIFIIFKGESHFLIYSLKINKIIQCVYQPFNFDKQVKCNVLQYEKNPDFVVFSYSQTIKIMKYKYNEKNDICEFKTLYLKNFAHTSFSCQKAVFKDSIMKSETSKILQQDGAEVKNCYEKDDISEVQK